MKFLPCFVAACLGLCAVVSPARAADVSGPVYELRTYTTLPGRYEALLTRFRDHTLKLFEKHGMVNVGYWTPVEARDGAGEKLIYLLEHGNRDAAKASWKAFGADPQWQAARNKSEESGKIVAKVESVFLSAADYTKAMTDGNGRGGQRLFELRTYVAAPGKLADLDARFRHHTVALFARHGMTNLGYFHPTDPDKGGGTTLIYFLAHAGTDAAAAAWKGFREDPVWVKARTESEKNGKLTAKVESIYLKPVDFSKIK